jgi:predicted AlkP superfamily phosphohydrolase/phosphomutase
MRKKLILLGIDGGTWNLIKPLKDEGQLPTFQELTELGTEGTLISTIPPNTHPAWTSIFTGTNPGKHGIADCIIRKDNSIFSVATSKDRMVDSVWQILSNFGLRSIVVNDPVTYPPEKINGILTTGLCTPHGSQNFVYPQELRSELNKVVGSYECDIPIDFDEMVATNKDKAYERLVEFAEKTVKCSLYLARNYEWDVLAVIFTSIDRVQHFFWNDNRYVKNHYKWLDAAVKKFLELEPDANIIGVSDHGFGPLTRCFYVNNWLFSLGLLKLKKSTIRSWMSRHGLTYTRIVRELLKIKAYSMVAKLTPHWIKSRIPISNHEEKASIHYDESIAYVLNTNGGIFINERILNKHEKRKWRDRVFVNLRKVIDREAPVISDIFYNNEVLQGPYIHRGADVLLLTREGYEISSYLYPSGMFGPPIITKARRTGTHRPKGIFFGYGPYIKKGYRLNSYVHTWDITPTLLHMLGLPIPDYMDGRVLKEIFRKGTMPDKSPVKSQKYNKFKTGKLLKKLTPGLQIGGSKIRNLPQEEVYRKDLDRSNCQTTDGKRGNALLE